MLRRTATPAQEQQHGRPPRRAIEPGRPVECSISALLRLSAGSRSRASHGFHASQLGSSGGERRSGLDRSAVACAGAEHDGGDHRREPDHAGRPDGRPRERERIATARKPKRRRSPPPTAAPRQVAREHAHCAARRSARKFTASRRRRTPRLAREDRRREREAPPRPRRRRCRSSGFPSGRGARFSRPLIAVRRPLSRRRRVLDELMRMRNRRSTKDAKPMQVPRSSHAARCRSARRPSSRCPRRSGSRRRPRARPGRPRSRGAVPRSSRSGVGSVIADGARAARKSGAQPSGPPPALNAPAPPFARPCRAAASVAARSRRPVGERHEAAS